MGEIDASTAIQLSNFISNITSNISYLDTKSEFKIMIYTQVKDYVLDVTSEQKLSAEEYNRLWSAFDNRLNEITLCYQYGHMETPLTKLIKETVHMQEPIKESEIKSRIEEVCKPRSLEDEFLGANINIETALNMIIKNEIYNILHKD